MGAWRRNRDTNSMWLATTNYIKASAREELGVSTGVSSGHKGDWWWNEVVQGKVKAKKAAYMKLVGSIGEEERRACMERYKVSRKKAKLSVTQAKIVSYGRMYEELGKKAEEKKLFRDRHIVLGELEHSESHRDFGHYRRIKVEEVVWAMRKMSRGRATGPDEIPVEFWKCVGRAGLKWLTGLFNVIFKAKWMLDEWRWSTMVPLYKNNGDIQSCNNYRGIKLLSHAMKVWERVVEARVNMTVFVSDNKFGFMPGRSTTEAIHLVRSNKGTFGLGFRPTQADEDKANHYKKHGWVLQQPIPHIFYTFDKKRLQEGKYSSAQAKIDEICNGLGQIFSEVNMIQVGEGTSCVNMQLIFPNIMLNNWEAAPLPTRKES
uniref:Reverse transcriptase domain-containing protein n=1 Tax=Nicotiana tabacum TaxID=4097 RepID=A0A1S4D5J2_TOBAC|nr:PREDICTED: uncharacterized protein LOC107826111 [Nicotiana tabacum]